MISISSILLGLLAAAAWGSGDFIGGYLSKRVSALFVVIAFDIVGALGLATSAVAAAEPAPGSMDLIYSAAAGIVGAGAITMFYRGLALHPMGLMAPLTALLTGLVPVLFGIVLEGVPGGLQLIGMGLALVAIWFVSGGTGGLGENTDSQRSALVIAASAGLGFGLFFVLFDRVSEGAVYWPIAASRMAAILFMGLVLLLRPNSFRESIRRMNIRLAGILFLGGVFDASGNVFFVLAAQAGRLDVSSVLASLFPAATVGLAWIFLRERLDRRQLTGVFAAIAAVVLISI